MTSQLSFKIPDEAAESGPQERLEEVWLQLRMPDAQRLDMAIKYSGTEWFSRLEDVRVATQSKT